MLNCLLLNQLTHRQIHTHTDKTITVPFCLRFVARVIIIILQLNHKMFLPHSLSIEYAETYTNLVGGQSYEQEYVNFSARTCMIDNYLEQFSHKVHNPAYH